MSNKIIIHLSDPHVSIHLDGDGKPLTEIKSWLTTLHDESQNKNFIDEFIRYINERFPDNEKFIVITGDLADQSLQQEYVFLKKILDRILEGLKVEIDHVMILPGDHDVNRAKLALAYEKSDKSKFAYELSEDKFFFFSEFYRDFLKRDFQYDKVICDKLVFEQEKLIMIGLNSNGRIGTMGGLGYIDNDQLNEELKALNAGLVDYSKVALFHHNLSGQYESNPDGQWDHQNKIEILRTLENHQFKVVFFGNEHTSGSNSSNQLAQISVGSFAKKGSLAGFKTYTIVSKDESLSFEHRRYSLVSDNARTGFPFGSWSEIELNKQNENIPIIIIRNPAPKEEIKAQNLTADKQADEKTVEADALPNEVSAAVLKTQSPQFDFNNNDYHKKLFEIVRKLELFKSGHFHWSDSSKAHNWIDVPMLLSNREHVFLAQKAILNIIEQNNIEFDFVVALGIEGNIIASYTALRTNKPYSYLPYSYRYQDHEEYEKNISLKNEGRYKKILVITDVVNNGKTVDRLLQSETEFFSGDYVNKISVVCLFYTGEKDSGLMDLNPNERIQHYFVSHMKVERCPYGKDFRDSCMIYREKLACVHEFYDANI